MNTFKRILALFLAALLTAALLPTAVFATPIEWYTGDGELIDTFVCDDCGEATFAEGETGSICFPNYCPDCGEDDDHQYCDDCVCSSCYRCNEHCICEARDELPIEYTGDEITLPDFPELPDFPDYETMVDELEDLLGRARAGLVSEHKFSRSEDGRMQADAWQFYELLCGKSDEESCIDALRSNANYREQIVKYDSTYADGKTASADAKFGLKLLADSAFDKVMKEKLQWTDKTTVDQKYESLEALLTVLKKNAKAIGISQEELDKLKIVRTDAGTVAAMRFSIIMEGAFDDEVRPYHYEIEVPLRTIDTTTSGWNLAELFCHEFQHFIAKLEKNTVYDPSVNELTLSKNTTSSAVRFFLGEFTYSFPDYTYAQSRVDSEFEQHLDSLMRYMSQLDERVANQTMHKVFKKYQTVERDFASVLVGEFGYDIQPLAIAYLNKQKFGNGGLTYIDKMADLIPELGLIPTDFDMMKLPEVDDGDRESLDYNGGDEKNGYGIELMYRYMADDGTYYALPTRALFDWIVLKTGKEPFKWEDMIKATVGSRTEAKKRSVTKAPQDDVTSLAEEPSEPMPADLYEYYRALALMIKLTELGTVDETEYAKLIGGIEDLLDELETLALAMDGYDDVEADADALETQVEAAEACGEELEALAEAYDSLSFDIELAYDERCYKLEELGDEFNGYYAAALDTEDALELSPEDLTSNLQSAYEAAAEALQEELEDLYGELEPLLAELESKQDELEDILSELDSLSSDLETRCEEMEELQQQMEAAYDELEDLYAQLEKVNAALSEADSELPAADETPELLISVTVKDLNDAPVPGIGIYYTLPHSKEHQLLGKTDADGCLEVSVEESTQLHGWQLCAGLGKAVKDDAGLWYLASGDVTELFCVEVIDGVLTYVMRENFALWRTGNGEALNAGGLRVVLRGNQTDQGELVRESFYTTGKGQRTYPVPWDTYYETMLQNNKLTVNGQVVEERWKSYMTESMAGFYGAWLLPLSEDGQLPRQNAERVFAPLYKWENGQAVSQLVYAEDYLKEDPEEPSFMPYVSYAFDFGTVQPGRYELAVLLPDETAHFEEVTVVSGETLCVDANSWTTVTAEKSRVRRLKFKTAIYDLQGNRIDWLEEQAEPTFALCVSQTGQKVWSYVTFDANKASALMPVSCPKAGPNGQYDGIDFFGGQMYLLSARTDLRLLPVDYQYHCEYTNKSWKYRGAYIGYIYGLDADDTTTWYKPAYVEFVEHYYTTDGEIHYKTVKDTVQFELFWHGPNQLPYPEHWTIGQLIRPDFAVSQHENGILQNYLYRRDLATACGVTYTFRYGKTSREYTGTMPPVLRRMSTDSMINTTELLTFCDDNWKTVGIPDGLTGAAWMTTREIKGSDGKKVTLIAQSKTLYGNTATVYRFDFTPSCQTYGHVWAQSGDTVICSRCGTQDTAEMPQIIEYVVPDGVTVKPAPRGWYIDGLECPDGTPDGIDCVFAGWSEYPVGGTMLRPQLWEDADPYTAALKLVDGEYKTVKLYAVFKRTETVRIRDNDREGFVGNITFAVENVHTYENFGNQQKTCLLNENHLRNEVEQFDYCLCFRNGKAVLRPYDSTADGALVVMGNDRIGYKLGTESTVAAPTYLAYRDGELFADSTGTLFDICVKNGYAVITSREDGQSLVADGLELYTAGHQTSGLTAFRTGNIYFSKADGLPIEQELIFGQVPLQNQYSANYPNFTGAVAAVVEIRGGKVLAIHDVTDSVNFDVFFDIYGNPFGTAFIKENAASPQLTALIPFEAASSDRVPEITYGLQLGGTWQTRFRIGKDAYTHEGQAVYLLSYDGENICDAQCLTTPDGIVAAMPEWNFDLDIVNGQLPDGTYSVTVSANKCGHIGKPAKTLAATTYKIMLVNTLAHTVFPGFSSQYEPDITQEWLNEHLADPNIRAAVDELLQKYGWEGNLTLWLERLGISTVEGFEDLPNVHAVYFCDNHLTQVDPASVSDVDVVVLGKQQAKIPMYKYGGTVSAELSRVISRSNLQYVRKVTALDKNGSELDCTYVAATGRVEVQTVPRRAAEDEVTIRYEYELPYGAGKTALMTVYLTDSDTAELPEDSTETFTPYLHTVVTGTDRTDTFRFVLAQGEAADFVSVSGSGLGVFEPISYAEGGTYEYQLYQLVDKSVAYIYDTRIYTATVEVAADGTITSVTWSCAGEAVDSPVFVNRRNVAADTAVIEVHSEQLGFPPEAPDTYTWQLAAVTSGAPLPTSTTVSALGGEKAAFELPCTAAGTWVYQITQLAGENKLCTYDKAVYTVTVIALETEDGIQANLTGVSRTPALKGREIELVFQNKYKDARSHEHTYVNGYCTGCGLRCPTADYTDVPGETNWAHSGIDFCVERGLMGSTKTDALTFEPNTKVSRAMVASIMYRIAGAPAVEYKGSFTDVKAGKWFSDATEWAAQNGLAAGKGDGKFDPNGNVTRQELAVFMYKLAEFLGRDVTATADLSEFKDGATVPSWAKSYMEWAVADGLISGKGQKDGSTLLAPKDNATRAEFASIIARFMVR